MDALALGRRLAPHHALGAHHDQGQKRRDDDDEQRLLEAAAAADEVGIEEDGEELLRRRVLRNVRPADRIDATADPEVGESPTQGRGDAGPQDQPRRIGEGGGGDDDVIEIEELEAEDDGCRQLDRRQGASEGDGAREDRHVEGDEQELEPPPVPARADETVMDDADEGEQG